MASIGFFFHKATTVKCQVANDRALKSLPKTPPPLKRPLKDQFQSGLDMIFVFQLGDSNFPSLQSKP